MTTTAKKTTKKSAPKKAASKKATKTPEPTTPAVAETKTAKTKQVRDVKAKKLSALDAAAKVLGEAGAAMNCKEMIDAMAAKNYWTSPGGKTPHATLYSAILREIGTKKNESRFRKTDKGHFAAMKNG